MLGIGRFVGKDRSEGIPGEKTVRGWSTRGEGQGLHENGKGLATVLGITEYTKRKQSQASQLTWT